MSTGEPRYNPIHRLTHELDAFDRSVIAMYKAIHRELKLEVTGINWDVKMVLRYLFDRGPQTIPQLARLHKTSRQHLADVVASLRDKGYVAVSDNPKHKRSKLVHLSEKGTAFLNFSSQKLASIYDCLKESVDLRSVEETNEVVRQVRWAIDAKKWRNYDKSPYRP